MYLVKEQYESMDVLMHEYQILNYFYATEFPNKCQSAIFS
jgi:hypothetical protein